MQFPSFLENLDPSIYLSDNYVVLDFEIDTSGGHYGHARYPGNKMLLAVWKGGPKHPTLRGQTKTRWGSEYELSELLADISEADFVVAHNAKYELAWLRRMGIDLRKVLVFDTMLSEYVLLGNRSAGDGELYRPLSLSLEMACLRRGLPAKDPAVSLLMEHGVNPYDIPATWLQGRCASDVDSTERVFLDARNRLSKLGLLPVCFTRNLLLPVLVDIESEGICLDCTRVYEERARHVDILRTLEGQMAELTGGINWRSPIQIAEYMYDRLGFAELRKGDGSPRRTPIGRRLTDQKTIEKLLAGAKTDEQRQFATLRKEIGKVNAALVKNLDFYYGVCGEYDGVFYANLNQTNTATHRLSSTGIPLTFTSLSPGEVVKRQVQFQNSPRAFKKLFKPKREGWLICDADGSQLEFRVAAFLGQDAQAILDIQDPHWDAHITSGAAMEGVPYETLYKMYIEGTAAEKKRAKTIRQDAKPETFKPLYGGKRGSKKQERWYAEFARRYSGIVKEQERWINEVADTKRLITPWGLRFYWAYARRGRDGYVNVATAVSNYPVQSLATAEIIPIALVYLWHRIGQEGLDDRIRIVNTVHDSAPTEVHPDALGDFRRLAKQSFTTDVYHYLERVYGLDFNVPLGVGLVIGEHLGEGTEEKYDIYKDGREVKRA